MIINVILCFLALILLVASIFWAYLLIFMLWYRVPLISTSKTILKEALQLADIKPGERVVELGCGWAPFLFMAAKAEPKAHYLGIEVLRPILWWNRFKAKNLPVTFQNQDFFQVDFSEADVVYCYLWDTIMAQIYQQKWAELKTGARLISYDFPIKALSPEKIIKRGQSTLYLYVKA